MRALAIDPSLTSAGWCVVDDALLPARRKLVASGHEGTLNDLVPVARFMHIRSMVMDLLRRFKVDVVGIESPAFNAGTFKTTHFALMMFILEEVFRKRKDCVLFDPATLKLLATGSASAEKSDMQRALQIDRMSTEAVQSDEADAYHVARFSCRLMELRRGLILPDDLSAVEKRVFLQREQTRKVGGVQKVRRVAHVFRENSRVFEFSRVPEGSVELPKKSDISPALLEWLGPQV